jgi:hypothetical protein
MNGRCANTHQPGATQQRTTRHRREPFLTSATRASDPFLHIHYHAIVSHAIYNREICPQIDIGRQLPTHHHRDRIPLSRVQHPTFRLAPGAFLPSRLRYSNWPTSNMRSNLFILPAIALANPNVLLSEFFEPLQETPAQGNDTIGEGSLELVKRQAGCATGYDSCSNLGAPGLCCRTTQVCSADAAGHVACCPLNNACTGTIGAIATGVSSLVPTTTVTATTTTTGGAIIVVPGATTTATGGFTQETGAASRSTVPNSFYPFAFIATTYTNAAACSSAYTSCQTDAASCTADLASGRMGVTISAPNGGATITAIASIGPAAASSVCQSLSSQACYGLQVEACARYGNGNTGAGGRRCGDIYAMGAGVAVGIAGQMLR